MAVALDYEINATPEEGMDIYDHGESYGVNVKFVLAKTGIRVSAIQIHDNLDKLYEIEMAFEAIVTAMREHNMNCLSPEEFLDALEAECNLQQVVLHKGELLPAEGATKQRFCAPGYTYVYADSVDDALEKICETIVEENLFRFKQAREWLKSGCPIAKDTAETQVYSFEDWRRDK